ncbi:MAG: TolC family protein [Bacteroidetes bacterium]|nr:TolC family protein [Bacteroidota bacterium]MDA0972578.1 TolC family protein [Bacteroidota bacterium]
MNSRSLILLTSLLLGMALHSQDTWTLRRCVLTAWERNVDISRGELNQDLRAIDLKQGKYQLLPSLNAGATHGYNWGQTIDPFTNEFATDRVRNNNLFLSSQVTLFNGFTIQNNIKQARVNLKSSEEDLRKVKNDISLFVAQSFLSILLNQEQVAASEEQVAISRRQVDRMQRMVDVGQSALNSLYDLQSQLANDELALTNAENALIISRLNLGTLLLLTPEELAGFELNAPDMESFVIDKEIPNPLVIYATASSHLPEVKSAELQIQSSDVGLDIARGSRSPNITVNGSLGSGYSGNNLIPIGDPIIESQTIGIVEGTGQEVVSPDISFADFQTKSFNDQLDDNFNQSLSLRLNIPIFNQLQASSDVERAKLNYQDALLRKQGVSNQLLQDVQQAHADAVAARRSYEAALRSEEAMRLNFENAERRFEQQMINPVEFNDAKSRMAITETQVIRAHYDLIFRLTIIDFYMGKAIDL